MALSFNDSAARGISYDGDPGTFDGPEWLYVDATGLSSAEAFGTGQLNSTVDGTGIVSAEAFGILQMFLDANILPFGVVSGEAFGTTNVAVAWPIQLTGIASEEVFGAARPSLALGLSGISSLEAFGIVTIYEPWKADEVALVDNWSEASSRSDTWNKEIPLV